MKKKRQLPARIKAVLERRKSSASGTHHKRIDKAAEKRRAIREQD